MQKTLRTLKKTYRVQWQAEAVCQLLEENGRAHFITKRFDRVGGGKLHMQSLCGLMHLDFNQAGAHSYEQALQLIRQIVKKETQKTLEQQVRRTFFNIIARNQDDHTKNIAFLMNQNNDKKNKSIIAEKGLYISNREMEIQTDEGIKAITADNLVEASISYEIFNFKPK